MSEISEDNLKVLIKIKDKLQYVCKRIEGDEDIEN